MAVIDQLYILWTSTNVVSFKKMVSMYSRNGLKENWWDEIYLIIWGDSARLVAENEEIQEELQKMQEAGVALTACKACAEELGVAEALAEQGVELKYWGEPLTDVIKSEEHVLTI